MKNVNFDFRSQLCDACHSKHEGEDDIYYPDLCRRCQARMIAWVDSLLDALEAEGAPPKDLMRTIEPVPDWMRDEDGEQ